MTSEQHHSRRRFLDWHGYRRDTFETGLNIFLEYSETLIKQKLPSHRVPRVLRSIGKCLFVGLRDPIGSCGRQTNQIRGTDVDPHVGFVTALQRHLFGFDREPYAGSEIVAQLFELLQSLVGIFFRVEVVLPDGYLTLG